MWSPSNLKMSEQRTRRRNGTSRGPCGQCFLLWWVGLFSVASMPPTGGHLPWSPEGGLEKCGQVPPRGSQAPDEDGTRPRGRVLTIKLSLFRRHK